MKKDQIQSIEEILGLSSTGSTNEQAENILEFLVEPIDHGKSIVERRVTTRPTRTKPKPQKPVQVEKFSGEKLFFDVETIFFFCF